MAATSYDGTCKNCDSDLSVWIEVRKNLMEYQYLKFGV